MADALVTRPNRSAWLDLGHWYSRAWSGFKKAWIIICLLSAAIVFFEILPRLTVSDEWRMLKSHLLLFLDAMGRGDRTAAESIAWSVKMQCWLLSRMLLQWLLCLFPLIALLTVLLLMKANQAVRGPEGPPRSFRRLLLVALVHVILAVIKLGAFLLLIVPGVYLYVKLLFVSLIMLEEGIPPLPACRRSWQLTSGSFFPLLLLVIINTVIQMAASLTIIGLIPATGFVNTARAAALHELKTH
ncbi:hypothetical protein JXO52_12660 [bacterium]|nr:hypothetical protein [bacterium]